MSKNSTDSQISEFNFLLFKNTSCNYYNIGDSIKAV